MLREILGVVTKETAEKIRLFKYLIMGPLQCLSTLINTVLLQHFIPSKLAHRFQRVFKRYLSETWPGHGLF